MMTFEEVSNNNNLSIMDVLDLFNEYHMELNSKCKRKMTLDSKSLHTENYTDFGISLDLELEYCSRRYNINIIKGEY